MATLQSKRKRETQDMPNLRAAPGMTAPTHDFSQHHYMGGEDEVMGHTESGLDFAAVLSAHNNDSGEHDQQHQHDLQLQHQHEQDNVNNQHHGHVVQGGPSASDTAAAAMAQYHTMTVPQSTEEAFMRSAGEGVGDEPDSASAEPGASGHQQRSGFGFGGFDMDNTKNTKDSPDEGASPTAAQDNQTPSSKLQVGSDEWHRVRKDNHKEVERRRREAINEGISDLSKIVPGCEKNKGSILARSVQFITQLKENETQNIEKWTLEKLLTEQAIAELSSSCDKLKAECQRAWAECEQWKKAAQKAGVTIDDGDRIDVGVDDGE